MENTMQGTLSARFWSTVSVTMLLGFDGLKMKKPSLSALALLLVSAAFGAPTSATPVLVSDELPPPEQIAIPAAGTTVPMLDVGGRPAADLMLNGKGPYLFIVDTGASVTVVNEDLAQELSLPVTDHKVRIEDMKIGDTSLKGVTAITFPAFGQFGGDRPPRGVLSAGAFSGHLITLDYPGKRILFRNGELPVADGRQVFQYSSDDVLPKVPVRIGGREYRVHLDSGSPMDVSLPLRFRSELPLTGEPLEIGHAHTHEGDFPLYSATVKGVIEIGQYALDTKEIHLSDLRPGPEEPTGNIGYGVLRSFVVTLDSKDRRVKFER